MILSISEDMLKSAQINDWGSVTVLESQRSAMIIEYFAVPVATEELHAVAHNINKVLVIDKILIELGNQEREQLRENIKKVTQGRHALKVYSAI